MNGVFTRDSPGIRNGLGLGWNRAVLPASVVISSCGECSETVMTDSTRQAHVGGFHGSPEPSRA